MEQTEKNEKYAFYLPKNVSEAINHHMDIAGCNTRSSFVTEAVQFYVTYLNLNNPSEFLKAAIDSAFGKPLDAMNNRMGSLLFKVALEQNILNNLLAADMGLDESTYRKLRERCVREVKNTNGKVNLLDAIQYQQGKK